MNFFVIVQAALWDNAELLEDLLNGPELAHLNSCDRLGRTPLHAAASNDNSRCLPLLLHAGALCNIPAAEHKTVLHVAAETGYLQNVAVLLQYGANLLCRDINGCTALDLAEKMEHEQCCVLLKRAAGEAVCC
ncbi:hypothetical protein HAZT_HAZT009961 [Hyalella azteca]|uniref:Uncharacterized protein n=1 Tax=Hyalella azteca TaxID=294128 RepID=A0A6A0GP64_HYAAZ|nr:hypothetical protein HAZT_HAZT009961 [Hyalella azteca]